MIDSISLCFRSLIYIVLNHNSEEVVVLFRTPYKANNELILCVKKYSLYTKKTVADFLGKKEVRGIYG